ncbi:alpha/beta fold hydrolase [Effusibacillus consociatus]|uniref:Alpha/beta fold hydrolase n=1 Tax=Effusibacillus consociatus TaxID=1117041 RepID=A0ABV9Q4V0_9BACL
MLTATIQGIKIRYDRLGSGDPLILIHGLGERKEGWEQQYPLADTFDLIIPDLRGHGQSEGAEAISIENFARDILHLMDDLGLEQAHICGLSMGGVIAQELYRQVPARCQSLILVNTYYFVPWMAREILYHLEMWKLNFLPKALRMRLAAYTCLYSLDEQIIKRFHRSIAPERTSYTRSVASCLEVDNRRLLPTITVPTLIIGSDFDLLTPWWIQVFMHQAIPNSELVLIRNAGHMAKLERPEKFNTVIRRFLEKQKSQVAE